MKQCHVFISGTVQGVSYRYFVLQNAKELGLKGWVRNLDDGRVEALFQGNKELIEHMIELCRKGPELAKVLQLECQWEETSAEYTNYSIK